MSAGHYHYAFPHGRECTIDHPGSPPVIGVLSDGRCDNTFPCSHCHPEVNAPGETS